MAEAKTTYVHAYECICVCMWICMYACVNYVYMTFVMACACKGV